MSTPLIAVALTMPVPCQKCCRCIICQRCSTLVGSCPTSRSPTSAIAPTTSRVCHSRVASPQPMSPGSLVTTLTKTQFRILAWHTRLSMASIRIAYSSPRT